MGITENIINENCTDPSGNTLTNFDLLDDCRVVGLYTATTETTDFVSGATNLEYSSGSGCFDLLESGDHTDEWVNYTGETMTFTSETCTDVEVTITDQITYNRDSDTTNICFDGEIDAETNECLTNLESFDVVRTVEESEEKQIDLNETCCTDGFNFNWDEEENECKWCNQQTCEPGDIFKIILGSNENDGGYFEQENDEDCYLEVEFDYLFKYKCDELYDCVTGSTANTIDSIFSLDVDVNVEKDVENYTGFNTNYKTQYTEELFNVNNPISYLDGNNNTGILLEGDNCNKIIDNTKDDLGIYCGVIGEDTFYSGWLHHKITITNEAILSAITNEYIYLSFTVNDWDCNFYVLTDNIQLNKKCQKENKRTTTITTCPGFDLERVEDNKKSWLSNENEVNRRFDFKNRFTDYDVDHHKLVINSKEIDLRFSIPNAVETKVMGYIEDNPCLLEGDLNNIDCCCYCPVGYELSPDGTECILEDSFEISLCHNNRINLIDNGTFNTNLSGWTTSSGDTGEPSNKWVWSSYNGGSAQFTGYTEGGAIAQSAFTVGNTYEVNFDVCITAETKTFIDDFGYDLNPDNGCFSLFEGHDTSWQYATGDTFTIRCTGDTQVFVRQTTVVNYTGEDENAELCIDLEPLGGDIIDCMANSTSSDPFYISGNTSESHPAPISDINFELRNSGQTINTYNITSTGCTTFTETFDPNDPYLTFYADKERDHGVFLDNVFVSDCITYTAQTIDGVDDYGNEGTYFFEEATDFDFPLVDAQINQSRLFEDNNGDILEYNQNVENKLWGTGTTDTIYGRLNNVGVWTSLQNFTFKPLGEWIGFSYCLNINNSGVYSLAFGADDLLRIHWNGEKIVELQNNWNNIEHSHRGWFVIPIKLNSGKNIIEFEGKNDSNTAKQAAIGAEIYSATPSTLSGLTTENQLSGYTIFSTADRVGTLYDLTETNTSCPDGYAFDNCESGVTRCYKSERIDCTNDNCIEGCGDQNINILNKIDRPVTSFTTTDIFREEFYENFVDPRSRQTLNNYPLLRAIYDRYLNSTDHCENESGSFDYFKMEDFSKIVGDYWIDIIEQFVPSTTIWGSTFSYGNTIFDNNKFDYRRYSLFTCCEEPVTGSTCFSGETILPKFGSEFVDVIKRDVDEILGPDQLAPHTTGKTSSNNYNPLINYTANTTANTITNINIHDSLLDEFYVSGLTNNDINNFLITGTTSASTTVGPYFRRNEDFDYIFTGISADLDIISTSSGTTTATTVGTVSGTTTYYSGLTFDHPDCIDIERPGIECPYVYTMNMDIGSEFIGTVTKTPKE